MGGRFSIRTAGLLAAALLPAACASDGPPPEDTPPTPFAASAAAENAGAAHTELANGWTEVSVRLNETSTPARARDMAFYEAARLAEARNARSLYIAKDEAGLECRVTGRNEPSVMGSGDPLSAIVALTFVAVYSAFAPAETWAGSPTHRLHVYFSNSGAPAHGITPVSASEILGSLGPRLDESPVSGARDAPYADKDRKRWAAAAASNAQACAERQARAKEKE